MEQDITVTATSLVSPDIVEINCSGAGAVYIFLDSSDTPTGFSYTIEGTSDGTNWFVVGAVDPTVPGTVFRSAQTTVTGSWVVPAGGLQMVRFRLDSIVGGTATITMNAGVGDGATHVAGGVIRLINSFVSLSPATSGGLTTKSVIIPNNTNLITVKASPGQLYGVRTSNNGNTWAYLKMYNDTTATVGIGTPFDRIAIPPGAFSYEFDNGVAYGTGIVAIVTTGIADNNSTVPAAGEYLISFDYK